MGKVSEERAGSSHFLSILMCFGLGQEKVRPSKMVTTLIPDDDEEDDDDDELLFGVPEVVVPAIFSIFFCLKSLIVFDDGGAASDRFFKLMTVTDGSLPDMD